MAMSSMWPLIKIIQVCRCMRKLTAGIPRPMHFIRPMLVCPRKDLIEITALMDNSHAVDSHFGHWLKCGICMAHENLSDIVEAVITVEGHFFLVHVFHG